MSPSGDVRAARREFVEKHQGEQADRLRLGEQFDEEASETDGFAAQIGTRQLGAGRSRIALVEDQIDHAEHGIEARREIGCGRHDIGNSRLADLRLGANDALGEGADAGKEGAGDFLGGQAAYLAKGERGLRIRRQGGVAAGEDEPQPVIGDALVFDHRLLGGFALEMNGEIVPRGVEAGAAAEPVDRLEAAGRHQPCPRIFRHAIARPLRRGGGKGVMQRLFGTVEVTEETDQRGKDAAELGTVD